jgi:small conductance mechanosensitive channel
MQTAKDGATASLTKLVALMKKRGLDDTTYSELLIRTTGQISTETLSAEVAKSFFAHQIADAEKWFRDRGPTIGFKIVLVIAILAGFKLLASLVRRGVRSLSRRSHWGASTLMQRFAARASGALVMLIGILVVLSQFDVEVSHMLAGLGIAGFIVGFALQDVLANFAAGIMVLIYRPYDVGDWIEVPDAIGKVQYMNLVSTTILTGDNQKLLVPNRKIWGSIIRNVTSEETRRVDLTFGIGYSDDIDRAERIFHEILKADERVLDTPEPLVRLTALGESSVDFIVRAWCRTEHYWELRWHITRRVKERFDEEGVSIPFPQRDVHLYRAKAPVVPGHA